MIYFNKNIKFILGFCVPYSVPYKIFFSKKIFSAKILLEVPSILNKFPSTNDLF